eukprot:3188718-Prymnesium_polylepis.1
MLPMRGKPQGSYSGDGSGSAELSSRRPFYLHLVVVTKGAQQQLVLRALESRHYLPLQVANRSQLLLAFRQDGADDWETLGLNEQCDYAWSSPHGTKSLEINARDASGGKLLGASGIPVERLREDLRSRLQPSGGPATTALSEPAVASFGCVLFYGGRNVGAVPGWFCVGRTSITFVCVSEPATGGASSGAKAKKKGRTSLPTMFSTGRSAANLLAEHSHSAAERRGSRGRSVSQVHVAADGLSESSLGAVGTSASELKAALRKTQFSSSDLDAPPAAAAAAAAAAENIETLLGQLKELPL